MIPTEFPEQNVVFAKDQPEYQPLPAFENETETISKWRLTFKERIALLFGRPLWIRQMNFGNPLQPIMPTIEFPFVKSEKK